MNSFKLFLENDSCIHELSPRLKKLNANLGEAYISDLPAMLKAIPPLAWQGKTYLVDMTSRLVAADFMDELDRPEEAKLLRDTEKHIYYDGIKIRAADEIRKERLLASQLPGRGRLRGSNNLPQDERQYLETALWSSTDENGDQLDLPIGYIHPETMAKMLADFRHFKHDNAEDIESHDLENVAHLFWLARNNHGIGFSSYPETYANSKKLQQNAKQYGEFNLYIGDDGLIHGS